MVLTGSQFNFIKDTLNYGNVGLYVTIVAWEHIMLFIKYLMQSLIPEYPKSVLKAMKQERRERHDKERKENKEKLEREKENSSHDSENSSLLAANYLEIDNNVQGIGDENSWAASHEINKLRQRKGSHINSSKKKVRSKSSQRSYAVATPRQSVSSNEYSVLQPRPSATSMWSMSSNGDTIQNARPSATPIRSKSRNRQTDQQSHTSATPIRSKSRSRHNDQQAHTSVTPKRSKSRSRHTDQQSHTSATPKRSKSRNRHTDKQSHTSATPIRSKSRSRHTDQQAHKSVTRRKVDEYKSLKIRKQDDDSALYDMEDDLSEDRFIKSVTTTRSHNREAKRKIQKRPSTTEDARRRKPDRK